MAITIQIQDDTWKMLNDRKEPGESFDSVIRKALNEIPSLNNKRAGTPVKSGKSSLPTRQASGQKEVNK